MLRAAATEHDRDAHLAPELPAHHRRTLVGARCGNLLACGTSAGFPGRRPARRRPSPSAFRLAGAAVHLYTASGSVLGLLIVLAAFDGRSTTALWLGPGHAVHRRHRRHARPPLPGQGDDPLVRRRPAGQHRRLPHLRLRAGRPALDDRTTCPDGALRLGRSRRCRCSRPATSSAGSTRRPTDHFFLGFPSYWNVVAFYVIVLDLGTTATAVDARRLRRSWCSCRSATSTRRGSRRCRQLTLALTRGLAGHLRGAARSSSPTRTRVVVALSLGYVAYYWRLSIWMTAARRRQRARQAAGQSQGSQGG